MPRRPYRLLLLLLLAAAGASAAAATAAATRAAATAAGTGDACMTASADCEQCVTLSNNLTATASLSCVWCSTGVIVSSNGTEADASKCVAGWFGGPQDDSCVPIADQPGSCYRCEDWRFGQCRVSYKVVWGLIFGFGGAMVLLFIGIVVYFTYKVYNRPDRYMILN